MNSHAESGSDDTHEDASIAELDTDVKQSSTSSGIASEVVSEFQQRQAQRKRLFANIVFLVWASFISLIVFIAWLGSGRLSLPGPAAVVAISALGVQPFVLIGILTRSVYKGFPDNGELEG